MSEANLFREYGRWRDISASFPLTVEKQNLQYTSPTCINDCVLYYSASPRNCSANVLKCLGAVLPWSSPRKRPPSALPFLRHHHRYGQVAHIYTTDFKKDTVLQCN